VDVLLLVQTFSVNKDGSLSDIVDGELCTQIEQGASTSELCGEKTEDQPATTHLICPPIPP